MATPKGPFKLVTVNTAPARAKIIIGRVAEALKEQYTIDYVANAERIEEVEEICKRTQPDMLFCASMWTLEESTQIRKIAADTVPGVKTMAIPEGLQVAKGPDGVFEFLMEKVPALIES